MAGLFPGLLTMIVYMLAILIVAKVRPDSAPRIETRPNLSERLNGLRGIWPLPILFVTLLGGMYLGFITPTEAAAIGALMSLVYGLAMRGFTLRGLVEAILNTLNSTAQIFMIAIGAVIFTRFLAISGLSPFLVEVIRGASFHPIFLFMVVSIMFVVLGMFLDPIGVMLLSIPVVVPIFDELGYNLIYIGVIVVKFVEIGLLTPPIGLNAFVIKSVVGDEISLADIFKGIGIFLVCEIIIMILLIGIPQISLFIPESLS
jgi:tripartite ATP-independent transporter DctM subunit